MVVRQAVPTDYNELVTFYKEFFPVHNIFQRPGNEVKHYLMNQGLRNKVLILIEDKQILAAVILVKKIESLDKSHAVWKLRHFAFKGTRVANDLLDHLEKEVKPQSKTSKIEVFLSDVESHMKIYRDNGFVLEGTLKNHYRFDESCLIFGKSL